MSDDWENEDFEPVAPNAVPTDKWEGEDEDDQVKDNWEDEDEEKRQEDDASKAKVYQRPKKKPLAERIAEKEKEKLLAAEKTEEVRDLTPEEKLAEKIRLQKVQEEADLKLAKGLFGMNENSSASGGIDAMLPTTKEEFDQLGEALKTKITFFEGSKFYSAFAEKLINDISVSLPVEDIKKIGIALNSLYHEKERIRKEQAKHQKKKKVKATIKMGAKHDDLGLADGAEAGTYFDEDEDFI